MTPSFESATITRPLYRRRAVPAHRSSSYARTVVLARSICVGGVLSFFQTSSVESIDGRGHAVARCRSGLDGAASIRRGSTSWTW